MKTVEAITYKGGVCRTQKPQFSCMTVIIINIIIITVKKKTLSAAKTSSTIIKQGNSPLHMYNSQKFGYRYHRSHTSTNLKKVWESQDSSRKP